MTTREEHFRVRNLDSDDYEKSRCFVKAETRESSVVLLTKPLGLKELALKNHEVKTFMGQTHQMEIRLDQRDVDQLQKRA